MVVEKLFESRQELFKSLAADCKAHLANALSANTKASLLASGGSTPAPLYEELSLSDLDWANISVALVDERWVEREHKASNTALLERSLLINNAKAAPFLEMKTAFASAKEGHESCEANYAQLPQPFTVTVLGMGPDGHTASLFPHADGLAEALAADAPLTAPLMANESEVTGPNTERMTLTLNGLMKSERMIVLLTGEEKLKVFREALGDGAVEDMPIRAVLRQNDVPVELYWAP